MHFALEVHKDFLVVEERVREETVESADNVEEVLGGGGRNSDAGVEVV